MSMKSSSAVCETSTRCKQFNSLVQSHINQPTYSLNEVAVLIDGREQAITSPVVARELGIGMVYQHFTLVPSMTVAENLVMSRGDIPAVVRWRAERERLAAFMEGVPFKVPLDTPVAQLAAGEIHSDNDFNLPVDLFVGKDQRVGAVKAERLVLR